jgi:uncharacterized protein YnzC (UPF0291/DUF896 family)
MTEQNLSENVLVSETEAIVDYFKIGNQHDLYVSASSLKHLSPQDGGCPQKFLDFVNGDLEQKESASLDRGNLVHKFAESPEEFIVSDVVEPSEMGVKWTLEVKKLIDEKGTDIYEDDESVAIILKAKENVGAYKNIKKVEVIVEKFQKECEDYLNFLYKADGKIAMTPATRKIVEACNNSLYSNLHINSLLFNKLGNFEEFKELVIIWTRNLDDVAIKMKAKLDDVTVYHDEKVIHINDIKTTSKALSLFQYEFRNYRIYRQMAFYVEAIRHRFSDLILAGYKIRINLCVVETVGYFNSAPVTLSNDWVQKGEREIKDLLRRVLYHQKSGNWTESMEVQVNSGYMELPKVDELGLNAF